MNSKLETSQILLHPVDTTGVLLRWVLVEGELQDVSRFANILPQKRPTAICPVCTQPVIMKLGRKKAHHCAHQPDSDCPATHPETAIHLNTKFHIYNELLHNHHPLLIEEQCHTCRNHAGIVEWIATWDTVEVEYSIQTKKPDIALIKDNHIIGVIEIFATHAVDEDKRQFYQEKEIPWIEVIASPLFYHPPKWTLEKALTVHNKGKTKSWICERCSGKIDHEGKYKVPRYYKIVDFYYPNGKYYREIFWSGVSIFPDNPKNQEETYWIAKGKTIKIIASGNSKKELSRFFYNLLYKYRNQTIIIDSPMDWFPIQRDTIHLSAKEIYQSNKEDWNQFALRYFWNEQYQRWYIFKYLDVFWYRNPNKIKENQEENQL